MRDIRNLRHTFCSEHQEYSNNNICCLNCRAGEYVKFPCTKAGHKGTCEECTFGTFTEHANGLNQCFKCTHCRSDQEVVEHCTLTQDTQCKCKPGRFCHPEEACEVCKTCSRCKNDEEVLRNCTSTSDTECKRIQDQADPPSDAVITGVVCGGLLLISAAAVWFCMRRSCRTDPQGSPSDGRKQEKKQEPFPILAPVNGIASLKACFEFFIDLDIDYHRRFFRDLGLTDNDIKSKEHLPYGDKIHELMNIWVEQEGRKASLNDLLEILLNLNQRTTAEKIKDKAVQNCYYCFES
ncbi:tumor necrosis factor receptor superfamily member 26 isoform X2 [Nothobranchius furzeri]|nr:tumor necrosis factor receptor superfamily member 26-like isoform X2 [Nothobranchius furzeri]XP_054594470.1 tumor necrosis factor receptor superfamily member 26-like isoform X2 [Nothobranchius furzeri]XP_054594471.1 tumor necrosis factor receptor superfamily member 26-like isoform X2 [Nothobranchius furzeri]XP_054594472.1 tumor necrosis factor receptor superfamily member 26-like isoform X2 [Nothobranchius furzeri]XP_054594473.1 tumor necrosis factor receptor superfamily member 26-like isofor